jgi:AraC-like DNA-binding protein
MSQSQTQRGLPGLVLPYGRVTGEEAFQEWSETVATIFDLDTSLENIDQFRFGFSAWHFGSLVLGLSHSDRIKFGRSSMTIGRSAVDHFLVQVYQTSGLVAEAEGKAVTVQPGDVWILDLSRTVQTAETSFRSTNLAIPRSVLAPLLKDPDALHNLKLDRESPLGGLLSRYLVDLAGQTHRMTPDEAVSAAESTVHLIAGCAGPSMDSIDFVRQGVANATLSAIRTYIDAELANPSLGVDGICRQFGLSRAALYRLVQPLGGVQAHIRRRRLGRCFHEIVSPRPDAARISEVGFRWGFGDEASFSRAFREAFDMSPSEARAAGRERYARVTNLRGPAAIGESELSQWIRDLMRL